MLVGGGIVLPLTMLTGCSPNGNLVTVLALIETGVELALPIISIPFPQLGIITPFLNDVTTAVNATANVLQGIDPVSKVAYNPKQTGLQEAETIAKIWSNAALSPVVLAQLPNTPIGTGGATVQSLVTAVVNAINEFFSLVATTLGASAAIAPPSSSNALASVAMTPSGRALLGGIHISRNFMGIGTSDMSKLKQIATNSATTLTVIKANGFHG